MFALWKEDKSKKLWTWKGTVRDGDWEAEDGRESNQSTLPMCEIKSKINQ